MSANTLRSKLRLKRVQHVAEEPGDMDTLAPRITLAGKVQQIADGGLQARKTCHDFVEHIQAASVVVDSASQEAEIELHRDQAVANLVSDVRGHLSQIGQTVLARQLPVFDVQLVRQTADLGGERL